jgi:hypothetical protein
LHPGDVVRVRYDAYTDEDPRVLHNGRVGRVSALRNGVVVTYDDGPQGSMGTRHMPEQLERQVPIRRRVTQ